MKKRKLAKLKAQAQGKIWSNYTNNKNESSYMINLEDELSMTS